MPNISVEFDGSDNYATGGSILSHEYNTPFSFAFWAKTTERWNFILSKRENTPFRGYSLYVTSGGLLEVCLCNTGGSSEILKYSDTIIYKSRWQHIVVSYTGSGLASGISIFIDGTEDTTSVSADTLGSNTIVNSADFNLSGRTNGSTGEFQGNLFQVGAYDKALSLAEVQEIYNGRVPIDLTTLSTSGNLTNYWIDGEDITFPTIEDKSGSDDLTMTSMAANDIVFNAPGMALERTYPTSQLVAGPSETVTYFYRAWNTNTVDWEFWNSVGSPDPNPPSGGPITGLTLLDVRAS